MSTKRPKVWFERQVLPDLVDDVAARVIMLGPADAVPDQPYADLDEAEGIIASVRRYDGAFMDRAPSLRIISRTGIGYDKVDVEAATERGVAVCNTPDGPTISTAEHTITLMLMVAKNIKQAEAALRNGQRDLYANHVSLELDRQVLGLVGFGRIARHVATIATGMGMRILAFDPFLDDKAFPAGSRVDSLEELLNRADVVSIHIPMTPDNEGLFDADAFAAMKPGAIFLNSARGGLVDLAALTAALDSGHLFSAGLDVTDPEPLPPDHPLLQRDDVVVTPHVASGTTAGKLRIFQMAFEQVVQVLNGERPPHLVNPEVWDRLAPT
jgi:D-3-phosphoglycerate dehydrogenase